MSPTSKAPEPPVYDAAYHAALADGARASAERVLPLLLDLAPARRMVDFGCGSGGWLAAAAALGVEEVVGIDGAWVDPARLEMPADRFRAADLAQPLDLGERFDMALCLEVAEHLPTEAADVLVDTLVRHAPAILFSAAVPGQGGEGHVNEAWPSLWRARFERRGYLALDGLRARIWDVSEIEPWYRQNLVVYADRRWLADAPALAERLGGPAPFDLVHPDLFVAKTRWLEEAARDLAACREDRMRTGVWAEEEIGRARAAAEAERRAREAAEGALAAIRASRSWRLTAPLRELSSRWRRLVRR